MRPPFRALAAGSLFVIVLGLLPLPTGLARDLEAAEPLGQSRSEEEGILILAHGGRAEWDAEVDLVAEATRAHAPTAVAFGMANRASIQEAVDQLIAQGVARITAVPLFVSSHSSVVRATEYLLGLRVEVPPQLAIFARMSHGARGGEGAAHAGDHDLGITPVASSVPIRMTAALNDHPIVGDILLSRAQAVSTRPSAEAVILVAHGPSSDDDNQRWLTDMKRLAPLVAAGGFGRVECLTVRDDADDAVWDRAKAELRQRVEKAHADGLSPLVVPLLLSYGGIERGIRERLEGLEYRMAPQGLLPDERIPEWVWSVGSVPDGTR
jgi:hypothetical protein